MSCEAVRQIFYNVWIFIDYKLHDFISNRSLEIHFVNILYELRHYLPHNPLWHDLIIFGDPML